MEMGRPCGKNGAANTGTDYVNVGRQNGQQENWATGRPDGQEQQEDIGHEQPKTGANGVDTHNIRRTKARNKQAVSTPVCLVMQVPAYQTEVYMSVPHL